MVVAEIENFKSAKKALIIISLIWLAIMKFEADLSNISFLGINLTVSESQAHYSLLATGSYTLVFLILFWRAALDDVLQQHIGDMSIYLSDHSITLSPDANFKDAVVKMTKYSPAESFKHRSKRARILFLYYVNGLIFPLGLFTYCVGSSIIVLDFL